MIHWTRRIALAALLVGVTSAAAQTYPERPITIVVPASPGGVTDLLGRALARRFAQDFGEPTVRAPPPIRLYGQLLQGDKAVQALAAAAVVEKSVPGQHGEPGPKPPLISEDIAALGELD